MSTAHQLLPKKVHTIKVSKNIVRHLLRTSIDSLGENLVQCDAMLCDDTAMETAYQIKLVANLFSYIWTMRSKNGFHVFITDYCLSKFNQTR